MPLMFIRSGNFKQFNSEKKKYHKHVLERLKELIGVVPFHNIPSNFISQISKN